MNRDLYYGVSEQAKASRHRMDDARVLLNATRWRGAMYEENMADEKLKKKNYDAIKRGYFSDSTDFVDVSDGFDDLIHIVVVSRKFDGRNMKEKEDLIWSELAQNLSLQEWGKVSLSIGASPDDIKAL